MKPLTRTLSVDSTAEPVPETADAPPEGPRFRLQHLFVLTTVIAVMLALSGPPQSFADELDSAWYQHMTAVWGIVAAILNSVAITVTGYGLYWRKRGRPFLVQPGHWLLLAMSIAALMGAVQAGGVRIVRLFYDFNVQPPPTGPPSLPSSTAMVVLIAIGVLSIAFAAVLIGLNIYFGRKQSESRWRWVFYLKAFAPFLWAFGQLVLVCWILRTIWIDRQTRVPRDATHQCGVVLELAIDTLMLVLFAGMMVFFVSQFS